jgi:pilus assembly protein Flp/PilA
MTTRQNERDVMNLTTYLRLRFLKNVLKDDSGQDLLEYALLVALIALVCVGVITSAGSGVKTIFTNITGELTKASGTP